MGVDDFELLTIIGRGAFGEVFFPSFSDFVQLFDEWFSIFSIVLSPSFTSLNVEYCLPLFLIHQGTVFLISYHTHIVWISFIPSLWGVLSLYAGQVMQRESFRTSLCYEEAEEV